MIVGVDSNIIENNNIKEFNEIGGQSDDNNKSRHPRTGFGFDANGNMKLITVDGRSSSSLGVNLREFAKIMSSYNIVKGYNLDGGGSTQAIFKNDDKLEIVNQPSGCNSKDAWVMLYCL